MNLFQISSAALLALAVASPAQAQTMKPGLWEVNTRMTSPDGEMQKAMAQMQAAMADMPPEQRKAMEDMMDKQGVNVRPGAGGAMVAKICMTKEMVARAALPVSNSGNCKEQRGALVNGRMKMSFTCTNPPSSGNAEFNFSSDTAYTMRMNSTAKTGGKTENMSMDASGRWLGADCGNIKPFQVPAN